MDINEQIEKQIEEEKKSVDYDTREFTIEIVVDKYLKYLKMNTTHVSIKSGLPAYTGAVCFFIYR